MFESSVLETLAADTELISYVSTYQGAPSIFCESVPEGVDFNYIVFTIEEDDNTGYHVMDSFDLKIDVFGYDKSGLTVRRAIRRIIEILDRQHLTHEYFDRIRIFKDSPMIYINNEDPKAKQYQLRFKARAGRSGWINNLTS